MAMQKETTPMVNISTNSLIVIDKTTNVKQCQIRQFNNGILSLTGFAVMQFLEGAELEVSDTTIKLMDTRAVKLILKLSKSIPLLQCEEKGARIDVDYKDLSFLRRWLELRMQHCEQERDARTTWNRGGIDFPKFNPDTYIGMKLLLLDLRELMLGEIID